jgi:hypothetical protein
MDNPDADPNKPHLEQVTYLERLNSGYQNEVGTNFHGDERHTDCV